MGKDLRTSGDTVCSRKNGQGALTTKAVLRNMIFSEPCGGEVVRHSQVVNVPQSSEFLKMSFLGPHPVCCRCAAPLTQTDMDARKKFADDNKLNPQISLKLNMNLPPYYFTIFSENVGNTEF